MTTVHPNRRLARDIQAFLRDPLTMHGIYYKHDEQNMFLGHALVVGPPDTPYFGGFYFFRFEFPHDYPCAPPKVTFTTEGARFHPNLYENGKVCLSILNTWQTDQWSSCLTISAVLLALLALFDAQPLLHEPNCTTDSRDFSKYTRYVHYKNLELAVHARSAHFTDEVGASLDANRHVLLEQNAEYGEKESEMEYLMVYGIGGVVYQYGAVWSRLLAKNDEAIVRVL